MRTNSGVSLLELSFTFSDDVELFGAHCEQAATSGAAMFYVVRQRWSEKGLYAPYHVCSVSVSFGSFALK